jgi:hypothetical protein
VALVPTFLRRRPGPSVCTPSASQAGTVAGQSRGDLGVLWRYRDVPTRLSHHNSCCSAQNFRTNFGSPGVPGSASDTAVATLSPRRSKRRAERVDHSRSQSAMRSNVSCHKRSGRPARNASRANRTRSGSPCGCSLGDIRGNTDSAYRLHVASKMRSTNPGSTPRRSRWRTSRRRPRPSSRRNSRA